MKSSRDVRLVSEAPPSIFASLWRGLRWWHAAVALSLVTVAAILPVGCGSEDPIDLGQGTTPTDKCKDGDHDGYGVGCSAGSDCDDTNGAITIECTCDHDAPGCACTEQGKRVACGQVESQVAGQTVCGYGETVCDGGVWSPCIINNTVTLAPNDGDKQGQTLGSVSACTTNPCDPYCNTFIDDPSGLTNAANGIIETDAGLTLIGDLDLPPAQCTTDPAVPYASCTHHLCETGGHLIAGCDNPPPPVAVPTVVSIFSETFSNNNAGWYATANSANAAVNALAAAEWNIAVSATASSGSQSGFFEDPAADVSPSADNKIAGVKVGGLATTTAHSYYYLYSPVIDASGTVGGTTGTLTYWRQLNSDSRPYMAVALEIWNGSGWTTIYQNTGNIINPVYVKETAWAQYSYTVPSSLLTANLQIRFSIATGCIPFGRCAYAVSSWNIDDIELKVTKMVTPPAAAGCVASVCAAMPSCCDPFGPGWNYNCTNLVPTTCVGTTCGQVNGVCAVCYQDTIDHDGDGFSYSNGDCADCDPNINPGAYDFPLNTVDEDCNGTPDDEPANCDSGIAGSPNAVSNIFDYVHSIDLCRTQGGSSWGVLTSPTPALVRADRWPNGPTQTPHNNGYAILSNYGTNNLPLGGSTMLSLSSGDARNRTAAGYVPPTLPPNGLQILNDSVNYPPGFPKAGQDANGIACPLPNDPDPLNPNPKAHDSAGLWMQIKTPTNAHSFSFDFFFLSAEYFTELCSDHNDSFVSLLQSQGHPLDAVNGDNVSYDLGGNVISVNSTFFTIPGSPFAFQHPKLVETGFDEKYQLQAHLPPAFSHAPGTCFSGVCGGGTDWLQTTVPIVPGETITLQFAVWDTKYKSRDSMVLIDNFQWSVSSATLQTAPIVPPPPVLFVEGTFERDYDVTNVCGPGTVPVWGLWSWTASTPSDSRIEFFVQTAADTASLSSAPMVPLEFSDPPWPSGPLTGSCSPAPCSGGVALAAATALSAASSTFDTTAGSTVVDTTLSTLGMERNYPVARITSKLKPSSDGLQAPTLSAWNLQVDCVPSE